MVLYLDFLVQACDLYRAIPDIAHYVMEHSDILCHCLYYFMVTRNNHSIIDEILLGQYEECNTKLFGV